LSREPSATETALLIIAHGSRECAANGDVHYLAEDLLQRGPYVTVEPSFLELAEPTIHQAAEACIKKGARNIILLPYFLSAGVHVRRDLTAAQRELSKRYCDVRFLLAEPLGRHPLLAEIVLERARLTADRPA